MSSTPNPQEPTPLTDPHGYFALFKFNLRLPRCPRTGLSVSYADIGDPNGVPVLFVPPSGCTRWFGAPQDPLAAGYGLRLIIVDRPGVGAVPMVPLADRIEVSCKLIVSVLEHLNVKPAHMIATSAGVYCALRLLSTYPSTFLTGLSPPPAVYLISPWSPPLPATDPLAYRQPLDWIPDALISTQDKTLPYVIPALKNAEEAYGTASKAVGEAMGAVKSWWGGLVGVSVGAGANVGAGITDQQPPPQPTRADDHPHNGADLDDADNTPNHTTARSEHAGRETIPMPEGDAINVEADTETDCKPRTRLWAPSAKYLTMDYLYAEDFRGIGQEHMLCLNRGSHTGPEWFVHELAGVAGAVRAAQTGAGRARSASGTDSDAEEGNERGAGHGGARGGEREGGRERTGSPSSSSPTIARSSGSGIVPDKLPIDVWWGGQDGMVPRNGQQWLSKALAAHPREIQFAAHFVEDGDHSDLMLRAQGIGEVYTAIMVQGNSTERTKAAASAEEPSASQVLDALAASLSINEDRQ